MAIKAMGTLIKLHKRRVDVLRREMVALEEERRQLLALSQRLREEHAREMQVASEDPKIAGFFGAYSARIRQRQENIALEVKRVDTAIEEKAAAIREEFSEQKKYEIAQEHAKKKLAEKARIAVQQRLDEVATQQYLKLKDIPV